MLASYTNNINTTTNNNNNNNNEEQQLLFQQLQLLQRQQEQRRLLDHSFPTVATEDFPYFASPPSSRPVSPPLSPPDFSTSSSVTTGSVDLSAYVDTTSSGLSGHPSMPSGTSQSAAATASQTPPIRVHQSSPPFGGHYWDQQALHSSMLSQTHGLQTSTTDNSNWKPEPPSARLLSPAKFHQRRSAPYNIHQHKRACSNSSSGGSAQSDSFSSPLGHANSAAPSGYSQQSSSSFSPSTAFNGYESYNTPQQSAVSKALPTPEHTPVQNNFLATQFPNYDHPAQDGEQGEVDIAMRRALFDQQRQQQQQQQQQQAPAEEDSSFQQYSLAPSVSTLSHNSPATPQTTYAEDFDDSSKTIPHDFNNQSGNNQMHVPKLNRTMSDIYQDELYNPTMMPQTSHVRNQSNMNVNVNSPYLIADRLQAARQGHISARSQSPTTMNRGRSPFRQGSPFAQSASSYSGAHMQQPSQLASEMQMGGQGNAMGLVQQENRTEPKTISPKDALLEYNESVEDGGDMGGDITGGDMQLFQTSQGGSNEHMSGSNFQTTPNVTSMGTFPNHYAQHPALLAQQYPFIQQQQQQQQPQHQQQQHQPQQQHTSNMMHQAMDFPTQATGDSTMNTTSASSTTPSQRQITVSTPASSRVKRPEDTTADSGTYTCTYHGCTHRFETPAKLQKHKREAHRQTTPGSGARDSPGSDIAMRNSQAGPHRCDRINPSTGKPCNSIFSRPYDLTRHEDTIHNARKQKVRCHLCTEEKTFSRNDALTRHMRVVHPEVDWPGKQKRKGRD